MIHPALSSNRHHRRLAGAAFLASASLLLTSSADHVRAQDLNVDGGSTYNSTTDASYATINVGISSNSTLNQTTGYLTANVLNPDSGTGQLNYGELHLGGSKSGNGTYYLSGGTLGVAGPSYLGENGTGVFNQSGGTFETRAIDDAGLYTPYDPIYLGYNTGSKGAYNANGGKLSAGAIEVGYSGRGEFIQSMGTVNTNGQTLILGNNASGNGVYTLYGTGSLTTGDTYVGNNGTGTFNQSGGTLTVNNGLSIGNQPGSSGTYTLSGTGNLTTQEVYVGNYGNGVFNQSGGYFETTAQDLYFGVGSGTSGTLALSGGRILTGSTHVGKYGSGKIVQTGGDFSTNGGTLTLGEESGSSGTYTLSGASTSYAGDVSIGYGGTGTFNQSGGNFTSYGDNFLLGVGTGSNGTYNLDGGSLVANSIRGGSGTSIFNFNGGTLLAAPYTERATIFMQGLTSANVRNGGAIIDTESFTLIISQVLSHTPNASDNATDGGLAKQDVGTLTLSGANTFNGPTTITGGTLNLANTNALQNSTLTPSSTGGNVTFDGSVRTIAFNVGGLAGDGNLALTSTSGSAVAVSVGVNNASTTYTGVLSGSGSLTKTGTGTLTLGGSAANTATGLTSVTSGTLVLAKTGGVLALGGALSVGNGNGPGAADSVVARLSSSFQTGTGTNLSVYADGLFDVNSTSTNVGALFLSGGEVRIGSGSLGLNGDVTVNGTASGSQITSTDYKNDLSLTNGTHTVTVADGGARYDLDVQAGVNNGTLVKAGPGTLRLAGVTNNGLSVTLNAGTLALATDGALGTSGGTFTLAGGTVVGDGGDRTVSNPVNVTGNATVGASVNGIPCNLTFTGATSLATGTVLTVGNNAATTFSGVISGAGSLTKSGSGTLTLSGANSFTGTTSVTGGTLLLNAAQSGTGSISVQGSGSTLGGTGSKTAAVSITSGGTLNPGNNAGVGGSAAVVGTLTVGSLTLDSTSYATFDLNSGSTYDRLSAYGTIALGGGALTLNVNPSATAYTVGQTLDLLHGNFGLSGAFNNFANNSLYTYGTDTFRANYTGTDFTLTVTSVTAVPEPATWAGGALLVGVAGWTLRRRLAGVRRAG